MKSILTTLLLFCAISISSQEISSELRYAFTNDDANSLEKLITKENINSCYEINNSSYALLSIAIKLNAKASFKLLIKQSADLNKECAGKTPLMYTAKYGRLEMAKMLIENKADANKSYKGRTALDYAKKYEKEKVYNYLSKL